MEFGAFFTDLWEQVEPFLLVPQMFGGIALLLLGGIVPFMFTLAIRSIVASLTPGSRMGRIAAFCFSESLVGLLLLLVFERAAVPLALTIPIVMAAYSYRWCVRGDGAEPPKPGCRTANALRMIIFGLPYPAALVGEFFIIFCVIPWHA